MLGSGQRVSCFDFQGGQLSQNHSLPKQSPGGNRGCVCARVCLLCSIARLASTRGRTLSAIVHVVWFMGPKSLQGPKFGVGGKTSLSKGC